MVLFFKIALVISNCVMCHNKEKSINIESLHPVPKCVNLNFMSSNTSRFLCLKIQPKACSYLSFLSHCNDWEAKLSAWDDAARGEAPVKAQRRQKKRCVGKSLRMLKKSFAPGKAHESACLASSVRGIGTLIESVHFEVRRQCMIVVHLNNKPDICQFWHTTAFFRPVGAHQKVQKVATR